MNVEFNPWQTPNFATLKLPPRPRQEGFVCTGNLPLREIPPEDLARLCDQFRAEVFAKAGKPDPHCPKTIPST